MKYKQVLQDIEQQISWYRSCAGAVSRDDMDTALRNISKIIHDATHGPIPLKQQKLNKKSKPLNNDF